jgi:hypothetical protein
LQSRFGIEAGQSVVTARRRGFRGAEYLLTDGAV